MLVTGLLAAATLRGYDNTGAHVQVFCLAFELLDQEWLAMRASYMDFSAVLSRVRKACDAALAAQPPDLATLRRLLPL